MGFTPVPTCRLPTSPKAHGSRSAIRAISHVSISPGLQVLHSTTAERTDGSSCLFSASPGLSPGMRRL